jgi:hypothetical protein
MRTCFMFSIGVLLAGNLLSAERPERQPNLVVILGVRPGIGCPARMTVGAALPTDASRCLLTSSEFSGIFKA